MVFSMFKSPASFAALKHQFKEELNIVLVSNETEAQLAKFIKARKDFTFPVIVDESNIGTQLFNHQHYLILLL